MTCDRMPSFPVCLGTDGPRKIGSPLGPGASVEAWGHSADELRQGTIAAIQTEKVGLPEHHTRNTVLEQGKGSRVF